jgi:hypothetical protein
MGQLLFPSLFSLEIQSSGSPFPRGDSGVPLASWSSAGTPVLSPPIFQLRDGKSGGRFLWRQCKGSSAPPGTQEGTPDIVSSTLQLWGLG